jgi:ferredoxin
MGSIDPDCVTVSGICIKCQACVKGCPEGAKYFDDKAYLSHVAMLEQTFTDEKENRFFYII